MSLGQHPAPRTSPELAQPGLKDKRLMSTPSPALEVLRVPSCLSPLPAPLHPGSLLQSHSSQDEGQLSSSGKGLGVV